MAPAVSAATELADEIDAGDFEDRAWMIDALERAAVLLRASELPPARWIIGEGVELKPGHAIIAGRVVALPPLPPADDFPCCAPGSTAHAPTLLPFCDCDSVDKYGDDLGEHGPRCPYHLAVLRISPSISARELDDLCVRTLRAMAAAS